MSIAESLLPEFDHEMATTRRVLERVPEREAGWKPHPKSMALGELAAHVANIPGWAQVTLGPDEFDVAPPGAAPYVPPGYADTPSLLARFDEAVAATRALLAATTDAAMMKTWRFKRGGKVMMAMPRAAAYRSFIMNHLIHHRGQLTVYLRLRDVPLPGVYGPSADEGNG